MREYVEITSPVTRVSLKELSRQSSTAAMCTDWLSTLRLRLLNWILSFKTGP
jgi:hypothetical protein